MHADLIMSWGTKKETKNKVRFKEWRLLFFIALRQVVSVEKKSYKISFDMRYVLWATYESISNKNERSSKKISTC